MDRLIEQRNNVSASDGSDEGAADKVVEIPVVQSYQMSELEILQLENLQLKDQILRFKLAGLENEMGDLVENVRIRLKLPIGKTVQFNRDSTVTVTED